MSNSTFPCTKCGSCCKMLDHWSTHPDLIPLRGQDGHTCIHLQPDNSCGIYAVRPLPCNFEHLYQIHGISKVATRTEWHDHIINTSCRVSIKQHGGEMPVMTNQNPAFITFSHNDEFEPQKFSIQTPRY